MKSMRVKLPKAVRKSIFPSLCMAHGLPEPVAEFRFHPSRKWRFDWAFIEQRIAFEQQGGLFVQGRHTRGAALLKEHEKLNAAAIAGWRIIYGTPADVSSGRIFETLKLALAG